MSWLGIEINVKPSIRSKKNSQGQMAGALMQTWSFSDVAYQQYQRKPIALCENERCCLRRKDSNPRYYGKKNKILNVVMVKNSRNNNCPYCGYFVRWSKEYSLSPHHY